MKLLIHVTSSFLDEIQRFNLQCTLHPRIYQKHALISRIVMLENWPQLDGRSEIGCFRPWQAKTEVPQCSYEWMEQGLSVDCARSSWKLELPLVNTLATVLESARTPCYLASIQLNYAHGWRIDQGWCKVYAEKWRKVERRSWRIFGSLDLDLKSVIIRPKAVMIKVIYVLLSMFANHD